MKIFVAALLLGCGGYLLMGDPDLPASAAVRVLGIHGGANCSMDGGTWQSVRAGMTLPPGSSLRTGAEGTVDLLLQYNGSVFRLAPAGELRIDQLRKVDTGLETVTETRLNITRGTLIGSQRKLHKPSILEIATPVGRALIRGTEYVVNAQGAVSVLSGSVEVVYSLPGNRGSVQVVVNAGYTFDPVTQTVIPTRPADLQNVTADVDAVRANAQVFKAAGATIVVKPEPDLSPSTPKGNNGVGNGQDPQPPGNPPVNDGPGTGPGNPGNR